MNNIKNEQEYQKSIKRFGETRVLGTFIIGSDRYAITIFFPTVQEIAINCPPLNSCVCDQEGEVHLVDFRLIPELLCEKDGFIYNIFLTNNFIISPLYQKVFSKMSEEISTLSMKSLIEGDGLNILITWLNKIFELYLQFRGGVQTKIFDALTKTEEKALIYILEEIGDEGILSISKAIASSGISRPVFTGLLDKLDRYQAAEIKNMGVKGTYINFYDHILSKFEIN